ncbi:hypothetical protein [Rhizobium gallicum]|nr:hypothetical protein [Rhizobium gallicum]
MFVVSIDDDGEERNFLATNIEFGVGVVSADICGRRKVFRSWEIIDVVSVDTMDSVLRWDERGAPQRRRLC